MSGANSLTVTQFIQLNPSLSTCTLSVGTTYCVSDDPAAAIPTTSLPAAAPTGSLVPSPDGSEGICGGSTGYTCLDSVYGDCCSENGYCGNTTEYCSEGCNPLFGRCGGGVPVDEPTSAPGGTPATATVTVTVTVVTGGGGGGPATCPAAPTRTLTATVTINQTVTRLQTVTQTQTVTTTAAAPARPSPILEGTTARCKPTSRQSFEDYCRC
jgi:hypothetical protein